MATVAGLIGLREVLERLDGNKRRIEEHGRRIEDRVVRGFGSSLRIGLLRVFVVVGGCWL